MNFRVPMRELAVKVGLVGCEPADYTIFLARYSEYHDRGETLEEYLNGDRVFLPMSSAGAPKIVNRDQIVWLKVGRAPVDEEGPGATRRGAIVELVDGLRIEGVVSIARPPEHSRVSDVLNDNAPFLAIEDDEHLRFINKRFVRLVIPG